MKESPGNPKKSEKGFAFEPTGVHFTKDETLLSGRVHSHNMNMQEVHDVMVDTLGANPEEIHLKDNDGKTYGGRNTARAAFGSWNSPWVTEADRRKQENAHLN